MAGPNRARTGAELEDLAIIEDGAVIIEQGRFTWTGCTDDVKPVGEVIDAEHALVTPGLIDAHTHTVFAGNRAQEFEWRIAGESYQEIAAKGGGIRSTMRATRGTLDLESQTRRHQHRLLQSGTTFFETKTGYGLNAEVECEHLRVAEPPLENASRTFLGAHAVPPEFDGDAKGYISSLISSIACAKELGAESIDAFLESGYFTPDVLRPYLEEGKRCGLDIRLHVDQLGDHGGAVFAAEMGAKTADHLEYTGVDGINALRDAKVMPVLLPGSVFGLGLNRYPDARAMIERGLPVALATDFNPGSSPTASLPFIMALACRAMKMSPAEALSACTMNPAASLNRAQQKGSIEAGKDADFVIWPYKDYRELAYWFGDSRPSGVFIRGVRQNLN